MSFDLHAVLQVAIKSGASDCHPWDREELHRKLLTSMKMCSVIWRKTSAGCCAVTRCCRDSFGTASSR